MLKVVNCFESFIILSFQTCYTGWLVNADQWCQYYQYWRQSFLSEDDVYKHLWQSTLHWLTRSAMFILTPMLYILSRECIKDNCQWAKAILAVSSLCLSVGVAVVCLRLSSSYLEWNILQSHECLIRDFGNIDHWK